MIFPFLEYFYFTNKNVDIFQPARDMHSSVFTTYKRYQFVGDFCGDERNNNDETATVNGITQHRTAAAAAAA